MHPVHRAYLVGDTPVIGPRAIAVHEVTEQAKLAIGRDHVRHAILFHNPNEDTLLRVLPEGEELRPRVGGIVIEPFACLLLTDSTGGNLGEDWARVRFNNGWQVVSDKPGRHHGLTIWDFTDAYDDAIGNGTNRTANLFIDVEIPSPKGHQHERLGRNAQPILHRYLNRRGVMFHNPGSERKAVAPQNLQASFGPGSVILPPGKHLEIVHGGKIRCNTGFNAVTADESDGVITVLEYV